LKGEKEGGEGVGDKVLPTKREDFVKRGYIFKGNKFPLVKGKGDTRGGFPRVRKGGLLSSAQGQGGFSDLIGGGEAREGKESVGRGSMRLRWKRGLQGGGKRGREEQGKRGGTIPGRKDS